MYKDIDQQFADFFPETIRPLVYLLSQRLREGHVCIPLSKEEKEILLNSPDNIWSQEDKAVPFIFENDYLYLQRYFRYEKNIVTHIKKRLENSRFKQAQYKLAIDGVQELIKTLSAKNNLDGLTEDEKIDWQLIAVIRTLMNDFSIITGGPGTGKTTTLSKLLRILFTISPDSKVAIAAPTGKASMRMLESLLHKAKGDIPDEIRKKIEALKPNTIHRLLGYIHHSIYFKHNAQNPLPYDWVIIDEASMIDMPMFAKLLDACGENTRILLLGDKNQLASVEAGSLLSDLCFSAGHLNVFTSSEIEWFNSFIPDHIRHITDKYERPDPSDLSTCITELRYSYRFQERGEIGKLSRAIIAGEHQEAIDLVEKSDGHMIHMIDHNHQQAFEHFVSGYLDFLMEEDISEALKKLNQQRVLATVKEGENGLYALNKLIEKILYQERPDLINPSNGFYHNRPVIVTRNNRELDLYNGDVGIVRRDESGKMTVYFEPNKVGKSPRPFSPASLNDCETVFAMTIHKSQGSEFTRVMVVLPDHADNRLLTRELIYTGVTRAISKAIIRGGKDCLVAGIERKVERISGIHERFKA